MKQIQAVIFDMDGLMLDSEQYYVLTAEKVLAAMGYQPDRALILSTTGITNDHSMVLYRERYGQEFDQQRFQGLCAEEMNRWYFDIGIPTKPGLFALLDYLRAHGIPCGVASSTYTARAERALQKAGVYDYMQQFVFGDQVAHSKPAPDIFVEAVRRMGVEARHCMGLEDSYNGLRASFAAGLYTVMVPDMLPPTPDILPHTHGCVDSLLDVIPLLERLNEGSVCTPCGF